jgi:hypothetical protein
MKPAVATMLAGLMTFSAMTPAIAGMTAQSKAPATPLRFGTVYLPCGIYPDTWHPDAAGSGFTFKPVMQPMEKHRSHLVTISNMTALHQNVRFLLMHGVADDNVHMQNSLTLLDKLDLAGVENYDVHVFPDSDHGIYFHNANRIVYDSKCDILSWWVSMAS